MKIENIIFDLDGTLIDSSSSILSSFRASFASIGRKPSRALMLDIIGPPLKETLSLLSSTDDPVLLDELATAFKAHYDTEGYRQTIAFPHVEEVLAKLATSGLSLYIATNKRIKPTELIIKHLGWERFFAGVYAPDSIKPPAISKGNLLAHVTSIHLIDPKCALYVGDRSEDRIAASENNILFAYANWGYGETLNNDQIGSIFLNTPTELLDFQN